MSMSEIAGNIGALSLKFQNLTELEPHLQHSREFEILEKDLQFYLDLIADYRTLSDLAAELDRAEAKSDMNAYFNIKIRMGELMLKMEHNNLPPSRQTPAILMLIEPSHLIAFISSRQLFQIYIGNDGRLKCLGGIGNPLKLKDGTINSELLPKIKDIFQIESTVVLDDLDPNEYEDMQSFVTRFALERQGVKITPEEASLAFEEAIY